MMEKYILLATILVLLGGVQCGVDNSGKEFVLCYMDNYITGSVTYDVEIYVTTASNDDANINVTTPLFDPAWISQTTVSRGNIQMLTVPTLIRGADVALDNLGVYITSDQDITVYSVNKEKFSTDAFIAYPVDSLGDDYIAASWTTVPEIMLAGVTDGTDVQITLSTSYTGSFDYNGLTYTGGDILSVTLNRFQTFHIYSAIGDLSGTRITANQEFTAFSGNYKTAVTDTNTQTTSDHLVEQLTPIKAYGKEFITFASPDRNVGDYLRVFAAEDSTTVTIDGSSYTINSNEYVTLNLPSDTYYWVSADKGVLAVMYSKTIGVSGSGDGPNGGDPAMSMCVPVALYGSDYTWSTVTTTVGDFNNYIIVVTKAIWKDELVLDNANFTTTWVDVIGNSDYVGTVLDVSPGAHSIYNSVPAHTFLGIAYGNAQYNSYAYASGMRLTAINLPCSPSAPVAGDLEDNDCDGMIDEETDNGIDDDGDGSIDEDLAIAPRVDGNWGSWGSWGSCSASCASQSGTMTRERPCDNPVPANFGLDCPGSSTETQACTAAATPCPVHGEWGDWGAWGNCGVTCGSGYQLRNRSCDNPAPQYGGNDCLGNDTDDMSCTISSYCLPSYYGNLDLACGNVSFACATGSITCIDLVFRCDGQVDCDDGTDESPFFAGCNWICNKSGAGHLVSSFIVVAIATLLSTLP